jgi:hypothetical protein
MLRLRCDQTTSVGLRSGGQAGSRMTFSQSRLAINSHIAVLMGC